MNKIYVHKKWTKKPGGKLYLKFTFNSIFVCSFLSIFFLACPFRLQLLLNIVCDAIQWCTIVAGVHTPIHFNRRFRFYSFYFSFNQWNFQQFYHFIVFRYFYLCCHSLCMFKMQFNLLILCTFRQSFAITIHCMLLI